MNMNPSKQLQTSSRAPVKTGEPAILPPAAVAGLAYLLMLLFIWGPFAQTSGMGWETYYTVASEASHTWRNFLYSPDPMRIHAANFYELAYRLGDWTGIRGSFVPYQIVYAALWWARSFLGFLLVRRIMPKPTILPFTVGAIMLVHAADLLIGWLGQLHQFGYFLWLLLSLLLLAGALQSAGVKAIIRVMAAWPFLYLCLWTYEAPVFIVLAAPLAFAFLLSRKLDRSGIAIVGLWYPPSVVYLYMSYVHYIRLGGSQYQASLVRKSFDSVTFLRDWAFNVDYSLAFWSWRRITGHIKGAEVVSLANGVVVVFIVAAVVICRQQQDGLDDAPASGLWRLLGIGFLFLLLSFPAHLLLAGARELRRTQLLSAISASMLLGGAACLIPAWIRRERFRSIVAMLLVVPVMWTGACRVVERQASQRAEWNVNLTAMRDLIRGISRVKDGTVIVMTNVPRDRDPFSAYAFWYNNALRLAYPHTVVGGVYFYDDTKAAPKDNLALSNGHWAYTGVGVSPMISSAGIDQTLVLEFQRTGPPKVMPNIPPFVCSGNCTQDGYRPETRILQGPPASEAIQRYGPL